MILYRALGQFNQRPRIGVFFTPRGVPYDQLWSGEQSAMPQYVIGTIGIGTRREHEDGHVDQDVLSRSLESADDLRDRIVVS